MTRNRCSLRLKEYNYSQAGAYFVTVCTKGRGYLFGDVVNGEMGLNECGENAEKCWREIPAHFPHVKLDEYIIMPNHTHGILLIIDTVGAKNFSPDNDLSKIAGAKNFSPLHDNIRPRGTTKTIGSIIRGFKIGVTKWARQKMYINDVWQRNYYEHIIRDEKDLNRIREYIKNNPLKWTEDRYYVEKGGNKCRENKNLN